MTSQKGTKRIYTRVYSVFLKRTRTGRTIESQSIILLYKFSPSSWMAERVSCQVSLAVKLHRLSVFNDHCNRSTSQMTALVFIFFGRIVDILEWMSLPPPPDFLRPEACLHGKDITKSEEKSANHTYCISSTRRFYEFKTLNAMSVYFQTRKLLKEKTMVILVPQRLTRPSCFLHHCRTVWRTKEVTWFHVRSACFWEHKT